MKTINSFRYTGNNHVTVIARKQDNEILSETMHATALSSEEAEAKISDLLSATLMDSVELNIKDFDIKKFTAFDTKRLLKSYEKMQDMLGVKEMIESILIKRGAIVIDEPLEPGEEITEAQKGNPEAQEEAKTPREYKKCMSDECLQARLAEARTNYKRYCKFLCTKDKHEHFGIIRSARLDKRSGFIQYRIEMIDIDAEPQNMLTGKIYGKADDAKDFSFLLDDETRNKLALIPAKTKKDEAKAENAETAEETANS